MFHEGCSRGHWSMGEMRKCSGRFMHWEEITRVVYSRARESTNCGHRGYSGADGKCSEPICANYARK